MSRPFLFILFAIALLVPSRAIGQPSTDALRIVSFEGERHCIHIKRGAQKVSPAVLTEVLIGDIIVITCHSVVLLESTDGKIERVAHRQSPYTVRRGRSSSAPNSWLDNLGLKLSETYDELQSGVALGEIDAPLRMSLPGLSTDKALVKSGTRRLSFEWSGGRAPYTIQIADRSRRLVRPAAISETKFITFAEPINLAPGEYLISITSEGETIQGGFTAISQIPPIPPIASDAVILPQTRRVVQAIALSDLDREVWSFEAYLQISAADEPVRELSPLEHLARAYLTSNRTLK